MAAAYYRGEFDNRNDRKRRPSILMIILDVLMAVVSVAAALLSAIIFLGRFIPPERMWYLSLAALAAPMVYMTVVIGTLYWIIRWKWRFATFMAIFALLGLFHVSLYYKLDMTKQYGEQKYDRNSLHVLTFNIRNCCGDNGRSTVDSIVRLVWNLRPDIVCFQEYPPEESTRKSIAAKLKDYSDVRESGTSACFSKYRIIASEEIPDFGSNASGMWTDLCAGSDTLRIFNLHLQTTSITSDDKEYIGSYKYISDTTREQRVHKMARNLRDNNLLRARQAETVHALVDECRYPVIVCGDFNDVPISYSCRTVSRGLYDTFSRRGRGYPHTFRGMYDLLRIDYILASPAFETLSYDIYPTELSDHYPVSARLKPVQKDKKL